MELLVATLAYIAPGRDTEALAHIRVIAGTTRNAPGLVSSHFYRGSGNEAYYLMLTTWEDDESWHRAQERYNPRQLLNVAATGLLAAPPEQWLMRYLWGYIRPTATPLIASAHLAALHRPTQGELIQREWLKRLRRQAKESHLGFAFLAQGTREAPLLRDQEHLSGVPHREEDAPQPVFLNLFSWTSEAERDGFYADPTYQAIDTFVRSVSTARVLPLEPL